MWERGMGRAGGSNRGKMGTTAVEQQQKFKKIKWHYYSGYIWCCLTHKMQLASVGPNTDCSIVGTSAHSLRTRIRDSSAIRPEMRTVNQMFHFASPTWNKYFFITLNSIGISFYVGQKYLRMMLCTSIIFWVIYFLLVLVMGTNNIERNIANFIKCRTQL